MEVWLLNLLSLQIWLLRKIMNDEFKECFVHRKWLGKQLNKTKIKHNNTLQIK